MALQELLIFTVSFSRSSSGQSQIPLLASNILCVSTFCLAAFFAFLDMVVRGSGHIESGLDVSLGFGKSSIDPHMAIWWTFL